MSGAVVTKPAKLKKNGKPKITWDLIKRQKVLIFMSFPFLIWLFIFSYIPLAGWILSFQNYKPRGNFLNDVMSAEWVGLDNFRRLLTDMQFHESFINTVGQSVFLLAIGFTMPIIFALLLNEIKQIKFKRVAQTVSYLPHFVSWVIVASILGVVLNSNGIVNTLLLNVGLIDSPINFLGSPSTAWPLIAISDTWKSVGWNAIIYIAAIASVDQNLYEAASIDGAGRWRKMWNVTLPSIRTTVIILLVLNIGNILNIGFERQILLGNPMNMSRMRTIDQYALNYGTSMARFSYATAIGMFRSVISLVLVLCANKFARKVDAGVF